MDWVLIGAMAIISLFFSNEGISYQFTEKGIDGDGSAVFGGMITEGGRRDICIIPL